MSGDHLHNDSQIEADFRLNDSHKHKDKHKDREHRHKEHKKDKEKDREKSKHSNSEHKDSEKKHKEKEKTKHKDGSSEKHKDKHKDRDKEKRKEEKIRAAGDAKIKKEKENGFSSPPRIKDEPEDDGYFVPPKEDIKPLKRPRDEDDFLRQGFSVAFGACPGTHFIDQAGLELKRFTCLCLPSAGIKGVRHRHPT